ncbi:hypothetical protein SS50377_21919 [Spironucleus salmonicida]|uniref:Uncharacterized protein n=1 Tax=Spironucleus salmonicida TaxID=348837 RepID=V6LUH3_9EUKA|nr:hypothetical protein SS50377_21919 [Spironucleus salmonicida]|eukprot:EST44459.1 Hypothetical protein SS50377_15769 [Spironucleus salmonicida]
MKIKQPNLLPLKIVSTKHLQGQHQYSLLPKYSPQRDTMLISLTQNSASNTHRVHQISNLSKSKIHKIQMVNAQSNRIKQQSISSSIQSLEEEILAIDTNQNNILRIANYHISSRVEYQHQYQIDEFKEIQLQLFGEKRNQ